MAQEGGGRIFEVGLFSRDYGTLVCLLFSTAIPTSLFIKQLFFILVSVYFFMILDHSVIFDKFQRS